MIVVIIMHKREALDNPTTFDDSAYVRETSRERVSQFPEIGRKLPPISKFSKFLVTGRSSPYIAMILVVR